jgi:hypothetical protein
MRRLLALAGIGVLAVILAAAALAATVGVTSVVTAGTTLSVAGGTPPTFNVTLNGADQTVNYTLSVIVIDARGGPEHNAFDVSALLQRTMKELTGSLGATRPGLLGETLPASMNSGAIKLLARTGNGLTYVFAVNTLRTPVKVQAHVPRIHHGPLQVFGERRAVYVNESRFIDTFGPLAVHVYVQRTDVH